MPKIFLATSRSIGEKCFDWAAKNTPAGFTFTSNIDEANFVFSVMYDKIFSASQIENKKCFNFHPGILPDYKGVGINTWVILNGEEKTGVTLHCIDSGIDTGSIIEIREFMISNEDTAFSLSNRSQSLIYKMFVDWYVDLLNGNYNAVSQQKSNTRPYFSKRLQAAKNITRFARAFHFPGKEQAYYFNAKKEKKHLVYDIEEEKNETNK